MLNRRLESARLAGFPSTMARSLAVVGIVVFLASPLVADRLVTMEGSVIETRGPWEVRGKTVVFTTPGGTLSSIRASEIDFEATEVANHDAPEKAEKPSVAPPRPESVLVLTDDDIGRGPTAPNADGAPSVADSTNEPSEASAGAGSDSPTTSSGLAQESAASDAGSVFDAAVDLEVRDWRVVDDGQIGGIELMGTVINRSAVVAVDLGVTVRFEGASGEESHEAFMGSPMVGPGRVVDFRIPLPGAISPPDEPTFEVQGRGLRPRVLGGVEDEAESEAEEATVPEGG